MMMIFMVKMTATINKQPMKCEAQLARRTHSYQQQQISDAKCTQGLPSGGVMSLEASSSSRAQVKAIRNRECNRLTILH